MPMEADELQQMLDDLRRARARGVQRVRVNGEEVWYKTDREMVAAIEDLERQIAAANGQRRARVFNPVTRNGWR